jgi:hypothetical protein
MELPVSFERVAFLGRPLLAFGIDGFGIELLAVVASVLTVPGSTLKFNLFPTASRDAAVEQRAQKARITILWLNRNAQCDTQNRLLAGDLQTALRSLSYPCWYRKFW